MRLQQVIHGNPQVIVQAEQEQVRQAAPINRRRIQGPGQLRQYFPPMPIANIPVIQQRIPAASGQVQAQLDFNRIMQGVELEDEGIDLFQPLEAQLQQRALQSQHDQMLNLLRSSVSQSIGSMQEEYSPALQGSIASPSVQRQIIINFDQPAGDLQGMGSANVEDIGSSNIEERKTPPGQRSPARDIRIAALEEEKKEEESSLLTPRVIREEREQQQLEAVEEQKESSEDYEYVILQAKTINFNQLEPILTPQQSKKIKDYYATVIYPYLSNFNSMTIDQIIEHAKSLQVQEFTDWYSREVEDRILDLFNIDIDGKIVYTNIIENKPISYIQTHQYLYSTDGFLNDGTFFYLQRYIQQIQGIQSSKNTQEEYYHKYDTFERKLKKNPLYNTIKKKVAQIKYDKDIYKLPITDYKPLIRAIGNEITRIIGYDAIFLEEVDENRSNIYKDGEISQFETTYLAQVMFILKFNQLIQKYSKSGLKQHVYQSLGSFLGYILVDAIPEGYKVKDILKYVKQEIESSDEENVYHSATFLKDLRVYGDVYKQPQTKILPTLDYVEAVSQEQREIQRTERIKVMGKRK